MAAEEQTPYELDREGRAAAPESRRPPSWVTNQKESVEAADGAETEDEADRQLPSVGDVASAFYEAYPQLARMPLTRQDGRKLRKELLEAATETYSEPSLISKLEDDGAGTDFEGTPPDDWSSGFEVTEVTHRNPATWGEAVVRLLQNHDDLRQTTLHMARGQPGEPERETFDVDAEGRFMASYQRKYYAKMKGWFREVCGVGERPTGVAPEGLYDDPTVVLLTRTASSIPGGDRLPPVDHFDALRESWSDVYHTMRNTLKRLLPSDDDWQFDRRLEPHPGDGPNECYPHEHVVLVINGDVSLSDLRPIVEKHADACEYAGENAHDLDIDDWDRNADDVNTAELIDPEGIDNLAGYVCDYASIEPDDLLERELDFVAFAAAAWATNTKTISRSDAAVWASKADACRQRFEHPDCEQEHDHGETVLRKEIRGNPVLVCAECETPHGIDQEQTLTAARLGDDAGGELVADGGDAEAAACALAWEEELREMFPSSRGGAATGETLKRRRVRRAIEKGLRTESEPSETEAIAAGMRAAQKAGMSLDQLRKLAREVLAGYDRCEETVGFERPPEWYLEAVTVKDERHEVDGGGGGDLLAETQLGGEMLVEWILEHTELQEMAAETRTWLEYDGVRARVRDVARILAERAGASVERCKQVIDEAVSVPKRPNPRVCDACWECAGTFEYNGQVACMTEWECWNCGETVRR